MLERSVAKKESLKIMNHEPPLQDGTRGEDLILHYKEHWD